MRKLKFILFFLVVTLNYILKAQDFLNDTALLNLDFEAMEAYGYDDTLDIMQEDYFDSLVYNPIPVSEADMYKYWCRRAYNFDTKREIDLRKNNQVYIKIYHDDFNSFDKDFWQSGNVGAGNNWHNYSTIHTTENGGDGNDKAFYTNDMESVSGGELLINTKYDPKQISWNLDPAVNKYDPFSSDTRTIEYFSGRVESKWAFDGSLDIKTPSSTSPVNWDNPIELTEDEGGIAIISKIKHPTQTHLLPAFWLMGDRPNSYDEFDIFEYFITDYWKRNDINVTLHSEHGSPGSGYECSEKTRNIANPGGFHIYSHFWNAFNLTTFCEDKRIFCRHQFSKKNRRYKFPNKLDNNKTYKIRQKYNRYPMHINFNTGVYPEMNNSSLNTWLAIDYIAVYKKFDCAVPRTYDATSSPKIKDGVFNVEIATTATFNYPVNAPSPIPDDQFFKLITNNTANVDIMTVSKWSTFHIEHTSADLCTDQLPARGEIAGIPENDGNSAEHDPINIQPTQSNFKTANTKNAFTIVSKESDFTICIYEINGKLVKKRDALGYGVVNIIKSEKLRNGLYIIQAYNQEKRISESFKYMVWHD